MRKLVKLNYYLTITTFINLFIATLAVWTYPKIWVFAGTTTLAWLLVIAEYIVAHKLHKSIVVQ